MDLPVTDLAVEVADGFWYYEQGDAQAAAAAAVSLLHRHEAARPGAIPLAPHRLYVMAKIRAGERELVIRQYAGLLKEDPGDPARRVLSALAQAADRRDQRGCAEAERLLALTVDDPDLAFWLHRSRLELHLQGCPGDARADRDALAALPSPEARGFLTALRLSTDPLDAELAADLAWTLAEQPWRVGSAALLWRQGAGGAALEAARAAALEAARRVADSPAAHLSRSGGALAVARAAGDRRLIAALSRQIRHIDPGAWPLVAHGEALARIRQAQARPSARLQLLDLAMIRRDLPADRRVRGAWWAAQASALQQDGQAEAGGAWARAARLDPALAPQATGAAIRSGLPDRAAERRLIALLDAPPEAPPLGWAAWREDQLAARARWYRWLGELCARRGAVAEAEAAWRMSLLLQPDGPTRLQLGRLLAAQAGDDPDLQAEALTELLGGLAMIGEGDGEGAGAGAGAGAGEDSAGVAEARAEVLRLWGTGGYWDARGYPELVAAFRALSEGQAARQQARAQAQAQAQGRPFPLALGDDPRGAVPTVVELWASWCGPCRTALPAVDRIAGEWPQIRFIAFSVDADQDAMRRFLADHPAQHLDMRWAGPTLMRDLGLSSIPATVLLSPDGSIQAILSGYEAGNRRLLGWLARPDAPPPAAP